MRGAVAVQQLRGAGLELTLSLNDENQKDPRVLPRRGDFYPAVVDWIALPPEWSKPIPIAELSPTTARHLHNLKSKLDTLEVSAEKVLKAPQTPFIDPLLQSPKHFRGLAKRMIKS